MHHAACFGGCQRARGLLNYFQRESKRHWPFTAHTCFQRLALDQFHGIEAFAVLLSVISHPSNIWMMNVRSCARFAQKTRSRIRILRDAAIYDLESYSPSLRLYRERGKLRPFLQPLARLENHPLRLPPRSVRISTVRALADLVPLVFPAVHRPRESQGQRDNADIRRSDQLESAVAHMSRRFP